jgi:pimeloyl-ACP methyl ester carboxylesterase
MLAGVVAVSDLNLGGGRVLRAYDTGPGGDVVFWHHGTPNLGAPPEPLLGDAARLGLRFVSYDRPGYGTSTPVPGRAVSTAAADTARIADALGIATFAVLGHSGGGPHALACAALLPGRVRAAAVISSPAPYGADGLDWFAGMTEPGALRAAVAGRAAKERYEAAPPASDVPFTPADWAALAGDWAWFDSVVAPALAAGPAALIDDDLAYVAPWGFDPAVVTAPVLVVHGDADEMIPPSHGRWLARRLPGAELRIVPGAGHISVLRAAPAALEWLSAAA